MRTSYLGEVTEGPLTRKAREPTKYPELKALIGYLHAGLNPWFIPFCLKRLPSVKKAYTSNSSCYMQDQSN